MDKETLHMVYTQFRMSYSYTEFKEYCADHGFDYPAVLVELAEYDKNLSDDHLVSPARKRTGSRRTDFELARMMPDLRRYVRGRLNRKQLAKRVGLSEWSISNLLSDARKHGFDLPYRRGLRKKDMPELIQFIIDYKAENDGNSPPLSAIAEGLGISKTTAHYYVQNGIENGTLSRNDAGQLMLEINHD